MARIKYVLNERRRAAIEAAAIIQAEAKGIKPEDRTPLFNRSSRPRPKKAKKGLTPGTPPRNKKVIGGQDCQSKYRCRRSRQIVTIILQQVHVSNHALAELDIRNIPFKLSSHLRLRCRQSGFNDSFRKRLFGLFVPRRRPRR